ncbi:unnamed protein product [Mytilus coruscus]|uniref:Uncharacterized protein n=1 Tax=Mytilus coruscus TaxID=42192 RepID=A0A6J8ECP8_MYTCO|nr:unnamed protein product [Mytilus coruscus]
MCRGAKEKFTYSRKEMDKTRGGPPPTQLSSVKENIVNAMKDSASFSGVGATDITCNETNPVTNGSQSPCTATPRPTAEESVWIRALDRYHSNNLQNNQHTCPVADDAEEIVEMSHVQVQVVKHLPSLKLKYLQVHAGNVTTHLQEEIPHFMTLAMFNNYNIQPTPKKKKTAEDVYSLQCAVLEKEFEKNILQIGLLKYLLCKYDNLDSDALELLSVGAVIVKT